MSEQAEVFLKKLNDQISEGQFDNVLTIPFMSRDLLRSSFQARMNKKVETHSTPLLSSTEIEDAIKDVEEIAVSTAAIFLEVGILENTAEGTQLSEKWKKYLKFI